MPKVLAVILGGGKGTRLCPLTEYRSKPAVPLAGKYRLIDIPISNCLNSGINRIYLLTQFNSVSLHRHIRQTYVFDRFDGGFVEILAAQQTTEKADWYQGTADAVRKNLRYLEQSDIDYVLILSGDQLYRMDYEQMLATHLKTKADVTIAGLPVNRDAARSFGIMRFDETGLVKGFLEKPKTDAEIDIVRTDPAWIEAQGIPSNGRDCVASMGIYLFSRDVLVKLLANSDYEDFGKEVFPMSIRTHRVQLHLFDGYWEDIGTIRSFYDANIELTKPNSAFALDVPGKPIFTHARSLPPTRIGDSSVRNSLLSDGCMIGDGCVIENSVIGLRCRIGNNVTIRNSIIMGADYFQRDEDRLADIAANRPIVGIGDGSHIEQAILDKNCRLGKGVKIIPRPNSPDCKDSVCVQDGIIVVPKDLSLSDGWSL